MSTTFTPQIIGQTEKALNAILDRHLADTGVSEPQWVTLTLAVMSGGSIPRDVLLGRVVHASKVSDDVALGHVSALQAAGLIDPGEGPTITVTEAGERFHRRIRTTNNELTGRLWGDLPIEDLDTAGRVLETILARANEELAAGEV
jgi:hypothetical protein